MKKKVVSNPIKEHAHKCLELSLDIKEKLEVYDHEKDGGLTPWFLEGIGKYSAEEAIYNTCAATEFLTEYYIEDENFQKSLDAHLLKQQYFGANFTAVDALVLLEVIFKGAFNLYTPAFFEMFKLKTNPELFTDDDLTYIREKFIDESYN